jgi:hypothetical protein
MERTNPKVGETWLDRSGQKIVIYNVYDGEKPVVGLNEKKALVAYTKEGFIVGPKYPHAYDLMEKM